MKRAAGLLALLLLLAACPGTGPTPLPNDQISADFPPGGIASQIEITAIDRLPMRGAQLIAPDGHVTPAILVTANPAPTDIFTQQSLGATYAASNFGATRIGSGGLTNIAPNPVTPKPVGAAPQTETRVLAIVSTASIQLPDPVAYSREWQRYRIRLRFGTPPEVETREIAAPSPPPPAVPPPAVPLPAG
jgi:hypothetical protein